MDLQLDGKRALVTGSTSGIGEAIAKALAAEGAAVVVHGRREGEARRVADAITQAGGKAAVAIGDLADDAGADAVADAARSAFGGLDILVNNAGAFPYFGWFDGDEDRWTILYNQNVVSMVRLVRRLVPAMREAGWGRVILIASGVGPQPPADGPAYAATKAANIIMAVSLSKALANTGVTVNAVSPGPIDTPGSRELFGGLAASQGASTDWADVERMALGMMPHAVDRLGRPEDIAAMVAFLASPRADYITGANMRVDGGFVQAGN